jgi:cytochrome c oxidase subunit 2
MTDGSTVNVDENYIRESIMDPQAKIRKGYPPAMPTFKGLLNDDEITYLIEYIKTLK